jgi:hypothetical protein
VWIAAGVVALAAVLAVVLVMTSRPHAAKTNISYLTEATLVDRASFPALEGAVWTTGMYSGLAVPRVLPAECAGLVGPGSDADQTVQARLELGPLGLDREQHTIIEVTLQKPGNHPDFNDLVKKCASYTWGDHAGRANLVSLPGLPQWATAAELHEEVDPGVWHTEVMILGADRGVLIRAMYHEGGGEPRPDRTSALVNTFNQQVAKLENA